MTDSLKARVARAASTVWSDRNSMLSNEPDEMVSLMLRTLHSNSLRSAREIDPSEHGSKRNRGPSNRKPTKQGFQQQNTEPWGNIPHLQLQCLSVYQTEGDKQEMCFFFPPIRIKDPTCSQQNFILFFKNFQDSLSEWTSILEWAVILTVKASRMTSGWRM